MSVNDFDQTVPLPTNGEETTPLPVGNDAPEVPQPASASDETATLPSGLVSETRELPVTEDAAPSSAKQAEAETKVSTDSAVPRNESAPQAPSSTSATYTSPQAGTSGAAAWATSAGQTQAPHSVSEPSVIPPTRVWSAEELKEAPYRGVRIGQLVWACIVIFTGVVLIALAFARMMDFALIAISTLAILGVLLMTIAGVSSLTSRKKRSDR